MRIIDANDIEESVYNLTLITAFNINEKERGFLKIAINEEESDIARNVIGDILNNAKIAEKERIPLCQDTGTAIYYVEIGNELMIKGDLLKNAINNGMRRAYNDGYLRKSIVNDPLFNRANTGDNSPAMIHFDEIRGDKLKITYIAKGGGSDNVSKIWMYQPTEDLEIIMNNIVNFIKDNGMNACPPLIVGIGIGGTFDYAAFLAKKALTRQLKEYNKNKDYAELEKTLLKRINNTGLGPMGYGGKTTALAVNVEYAPCHLASLPVAINLNCHSHRTGRIIL
ncbi:fumarate hydratase [candidate division TA06 bacterium]|uniref:Fumarate hydratase n=1 Tax=candidate division TA06 bacterium TaxID=2250710 RepID=A0A660SRA5_UNCT6|nr:MAG: fumarate hydratase [candidate division TA06 bacterium]